MLSRTIGILLTSVSMGTAQAGVILLNNAGFVSAVDAVAGQQSAEREVLTIPSSYDLVAQRGSSVARNNAQYSVDSGQTVFSHDVSMVRSGLIGSPVSNVSAALFEFRFMVQENISYALSGSFFIDDFGVAGRSNFQVSLRDVTANQSLFFGNQRSNSTIDESFVLGESGGDEFNSLSGSLTGTLIAGRVYRWEFISQSSAASNSDQGASAMGNLTLRVGERTPATPATPTAPQNTVDLPETLPLAAIALMMLFATGRGRRNCLITRH